MDRATVFGTVGWGFKSLWVCHVFQQLILNMSKKSVTPVSKVCLNF